MWISHQPDDADIDYFRVNFPFLAAHSQAAGPSMIRPLRQSVSLRNISASQDVNGEMRVLHTNHPMYSKIEDYIRDDGARVRIKASEHAFGK